MEKERTEEIRAKVLSLIDAEYESDAAFERSLALPPKTVNNWRRGRSASFIKMLPRLSECFEVSVGELLEIPPRAGSVELSDDELELLTLYRRTRTLPPAVREAMIKTIETTINLYISSKGDQKKSHTKKKQ